MTRPIIASELFALAHNANCQGDQRCHWCGAPCSRKWLHGDPPPLPFVRSSEPTKIPSSPYICVGCWLWRRPSVTIKFLEGGFKDGQCPAHHSWLFTGDGICVLKSSVRNSEMMNEMLRKPPNCFALSILDEHKKNYLQNMIVNDSVKIDSNTPLYFTINNIPFSYSVYELEEAFRNGDSSGKEPGVQALLRIFKIPSKTNSPEVLLSSMEPVNLEPEPIRRGRGRPPKRDDARILRETVSLSGHIQF